MASRGYGADAGAAPGAGAGEGTQMSRTFESQRADGRFVQTAGLLQSYMITLQPRLACRENMTAAEFPAWRKAVREKLLELLCFPADVPQQPPPKQLWTKAREGYQLQAWEAYPEPFSVVPFLVLVPAGASPQARRPAVMCFPGSTSSKESLAGEPELSTGQPASDPHWGTNRQALFFVQKGWIAVAIDNPATNETDSPLRDRARMSECALWMGRNYLGLSVFQKACILKWLSALPLVDARRIAVSGHSLGSNPADILGVLYPELVCAVVHNDFVCNWQERAIAGNCLPPGGAHHTVPGLFQWFDHTDLEAALAPCPLLFTEGGRTPQIDKIRRAYALQGAASRVEVFYYEKYATPDRRPLEYKDVPAGVTDAEYFEYANVDPANHRFRPERVVPWLAGVFGTDN
jgi:hypothetical protein